METTSVGPDDACLQRGKMMSFGGSKRWTRRRAWLLAMTVSLAGAAPAYAQTAPAEPSESAMVNLVRLLVKQGTLTKEAGDALMAQAQAEADAAKARSAATAQTASGELPPAAAGTIRVPYVPQSVRDQIRDDIKTEVLAQAKTEGWAAPEQAAPDWTRRISIHGDVRFRSQSNLYNTTNGNQFLDVGAINAAVPAYNLDATSAPIALPYLNSTNDRWNRLSIRARLGVEAQVASWVTAGVAIATGQDNSPISLDASLGGGLAKRDIWLDKAYIKLSYHDLANASFGRFVNPFDSTFLLFDPDLRFDGAAATIDVGHFFFGDRLGLRLTGGAFPLSYGSQDYPVTATDKRNLRTQYLFSGQITASAKLDDEKVEASVSAAYHDFSGVQGQLSQPCFANQTTNIVECSTDYQRPLYARKGNTLFTLRNIVDPVNPVPPQPQYLGLQFRYSVIDFIGRIKYQFTDTTSVHLTGEYLKNIAFTRRDICRAGGIRPYNNVVSANNSGSTDACAATNPDRFAGGDTGYLGEVAVRHGTSFKQGAWDAYAGYRYLETDATLDALTDSDFHLGGTNAKGYYVGGSYSFVDGLSLGARWLSANEVSGAPFAIDVLQVDLTAAF